MGISDGSSDGCSSDRVAAWGAMSGVLVFVARADGAGDLRRTGRVLREGLVLGLGFGVAAWIVLFGFASELLAAVGIVPALVPDAARVVRVMAFGFPFQLVIVAPATTASVAEIGRAHV